jgi:predicted DNA-binding transcriptional regulator YafY
LDEAFYGILWYGSKAEVLQPEALREKLIRELAEWGNVYDSSLMR